jgi:hypothetical protein
LRVPALANVGIVAGGSTEIPSKIVRSPSW